MKNAFLISLLLIAYNGFAQIICPDDITINCDQDYTDLSLTGQVMFNGNSELDSITAVNYIPNLDACGVGDVIVEHMAEDSLACTQTITIVNPFPQFDPSTIVFPSDTIYTNCNLNLDDAPTWLGGPCDFIGYMADVDTIELISAGEFTLLREYTIIDWCLYDDTNGDDGLYFGSQIIEVIDEKAPTPFCMNLWSVTMDELPLTITAKDFNAGVFDDCTPTEDIRFTFSDVSPEDDSEFDSSLNASVREITIDDIEDGLLSLEIHHWDSAGNSDFCVVFFTLITSTEDLEKQISLSNNYPNPFDRNTTIEFYLKEASDITISIMDINGQVLRQLTNRYASGTHTQTLEMEDIPSGLIYYKIESDKSSVVGKMVKL